MFEFKKTGQQQRNRFLLRAIVAGVFALGCFGVLVARFWVLQVDRSRAMLSLLVLSTLTPRGCSLFARLLCRRRRLARSTKCSLIFPRGVLPLPMVARYLCRHRCHCRLCRQRLDYPPLSPRRPLISSSKAFLCCLREPNLQSLN